MQLYFLRRPPLKTNLGETPQGTLRYLVRLDDLSLARPSSLQVFAPALKSWSWRATQGLGELLVDLCISIAVDVAGDELTDRGVAAS